VTNFKRSTKLYRLAMSYNRGLDRDKDGIACEKASPLHHPRRRPPRRPFLGSLFHLHGAARLAPRRWLLVG
jgi:hypothetical protein